MSGRLLPEGASPFPTVAAADSPDVWRKMGCCCRRAGVGAPYGKRVRFAGHLCKIALLLRGASGRRPLQGCLPYICQKESPADPHPPRWVRAEEPKEAQKLKIHKTLLQLLENRGKMKKGSAIRSRTGGFPPIIPLRKVSNPLITAEPKPAPYPHDTRTSSLLGDRVFLVHPLVRFVDLRRCCMFFARNT